MAELSLKDHPERTDVLFWFYFMIHSLGENLHINFILARDIHFLMKSSCSSVIVILYCYILLWTIDYLIIIIY